MVPYNYQIVNIPCYAWLPLVEGAKAIIRKMLQVAEKSWRKLNAPELLPLVVSGVTFKDGVMTKSGGLESAVSHQPERTAA